MILRALGKFSLGSFTVMLGLMILAISCGGGNCGGVFSSLSSGFREEPTGNILIEEPQKNEVVENPFTIHGSARVFSGTVYYKITDMQGILLSEGTLFTKGRNQQEHMPFQGSVKYSEPKSPIGKLTLFDRSPKDNRIVDSVSVSVLLTVEKSNILNNE